MAEPMPNRIFTDRGVIVHEPAWLDIPPDQIAPGTVIFPGCRISGKETWIGPGCRIGAEAPATLVDCRLARNVTFSGGYAEGAVFLDGASIGSGAHIRPGTLLEEHASCAHTVGLKQTLLMPFVTTGSLINFCDCLMAGGTGPKNHSEVGSSYIHFNFTPHQDKATPSLIGDVPRGVMLDCPPIFLGGQGGMVGPVRIAYGSILAAGTICRRDVTTEGMLVFGQAGGKRKEIPYNHSQYGDIDRVARNNFIYIGNLHALHAWYRHVRPLATPDDPFARACIEGAARLLTLAVGERIGQLTKMAAKITAAPGAHASHQRLMRLQSCLGRILSIKDAEIPTPPPVLTAAIKDHRNADYVQTMQALPKDARLAGTRWLQDIVDAVALQWEETGS